MLFPKESKMAVACLVRWVCRYLEEWSICQNHAQGVLWRNIFGVGQIYSLEFWRTLRGEPRWEQEWHLYNSPVISMRITNNCGNCTNKPWLLFFCKNAGMDGRISLKRFGAAMVLWGFRWAIDESSIIWESGVSLRIGGIVNWISCTDDQLIADRYIWNEMPTMSSTGSTSWLRGVWAIWVMLNADANALLTTIDMVLGTSLSGGKSPKEV